MHVEVYGNPFEITKNMELHEIHKSTQRFSVTAEMPALTTGSRAICNQRYF